MAEPGELFAPGRVAVLVMELQRGVVGDLASIPRLAKSVEEAGVTQNTARVLAAARVAGVRVIHCHAAFRRDRAGTPLNIPLVNRLLEPCLPSLDALQSSEAVGAVEVVRLESVPVGRREAAGEVLLENLSASHLVTSHGRLPELNFFS